MREHFALTCQECGFIRTFEWERDPAYEPPVIIVRCVGARAHSYRATAPDAAVSLRSGPARLIRDEEPQPSTLVYS